MKQLADIARAVGTSPATFYQYFSDVEDVVLHLAAEANEELPALLELFEGSWRGAKGQRRAKDVVVFFMDYWDTCGPILRIRNLAADEGDMRFMELRRAAWCPRWSAVVRRISIRKSYRVARRWQ
jgi:AcrR family transcriptional regulator